MREDAAFQRGQLTGLRDDFNGIISTIRDEDASLNQTISRLQSALQHHRELISLQQDKIVHIGVILYHLGVAHDDDNTDRVEEIISHFSGFEISDWVNERELEFENLDITHAIDTIFGQQDYQPSSSESDDHDYPSDEVTTSEEGEQDDDEASAPEEEQQDSDEESVASIDDLYDDE